MKEYLRQNPEFMAEIETQVRQKLAEESSAARVSKPASPAAVQETQEQPAAPKKPTNRAGAKAKLDIVVDDD